VGPVLILTGKKKTREYKPTNPHRPGRPRRMVSQSSALGQPVTGGIKRCRRCLRLGGAGRSCRSRLSPDGSCRTSPRCRDHQYRLVFQLFRSAGKSILSLAPCIGLRFRSVIPGMRRPFPTVRLSKRLKVIFYKDPGIDIHFDMNIRRKNTRTGYLVRHGVIPQTCSPKTQFFKPNPTRGFRKNED
jgi:hypothetical protein